MRLVLVGLLVAGCGRPASPGPGFDEDGDQDGAREVGLTGTTVLEGGNRGSVDHAAGDREDWKTFAVPAGVIGKLEVKLRPATTGSDFRLTVALYDSAGRRIGFGRTSRSGGSRRVVVAAAEAGTYFVRIAAPQSTRPSKYRFSVRFEQTGEVAGKGDDDDARKQADEARKNEDERKKIDDERKKVDDERKKVDDERKKIDDERRLAEEDKRKREAETNPPPQPVIAKVLRVYTHDGAVVVVIQLGKRAGVQRGWKVQALRDQSGGDIRGGEFPVLAVHEDRSEGRSTLPLNTLIQVKWVRVTPPAPPPAPAPP